MNHPNNHNRPFSDALARLRAAGLRPTRQRLALTRLLFSDGDRHVTAESLHKEAMADRVRVSLATVYNTLHQFTEAGLLREVTGSRTGCRRGSPFLPPRQNDAVERRL